MEFQMFSKSLLILPALYLAAAPGLAATQGSNGGAQDGAKDSITQPSSNTGGQSYGDRNRGGPYGFYSYPSHRHIDGGSLDRPLPTSGSAGTSPNYDGYHGSAYYGRDYGAPYFGGGYYDGGTYYRERRDH